MKLYSEIYGIETVSLRYFNVYGLRQSSSGAYASVIAKFIDFKKNSKAMTITGDGEQTRSFVHVSDVVKANINAMRSDNVGKGEVVNIGTNEMHSVNQ
ncbi:MAG: NAD-dependent epimerase/dehydratase, partial [Candidatus Roizmanbacteria bacterium GW2011_GWA1_41_13]